MIAPPMQPRSWFGLRWTSRRLMWHRMMRRMWYVRWMGRRRMMIMMRRMWYGRRMWRRKMSIGKAHWAIPCSVFPFLSLPLKFFCRKSSISISLSGCCSISLVHCFFLLNSRFTWVSDFWLLDVGAVVLIIQTKCLTMMPTWAVLVVKM